MKELGLRRDWDMERMYAGEEQAKKGEKKEGERRHKTKKWGKNKKSTEGREQKKRRTQRQKEKLQGRGFIREKNSQLAEIGLAQKIFISYPAAQALMIPRLKVYDTGR